MNWNEILYALFVMIGCLVILWVSIPIFAFMFGLALKIIFWVLTL